MKSVKLDQVKVGDVLGKSLFSEKGELMLAAGYELTDEMLRLLKKHGYHRLYLFDEATKDIRPLDVISEMVRAATTRRLHDSYGEVVKALDRIHTSPLHLKHRLADDPSLKKILPVGEVNKAVSGIVEELLDNNVSLLTSLPMKSETGKELQHAIDTAVLSVLLGQQFNYEYKELKLLGSASLLHDIGKMVFPQLAEKPDFMLSFQEKWLLREHPTYSMLILKGSDPHSYVEQTTILQHHERPDGKGYPQGLKGDNAAPLKAVEVDPTRIFRHAEILAVANAYDNFLSSELDGVRHTPQSAVSEMVQGAGSIFNPHILRALTKVVQFFPQGSEIRIHTTSSGTWDGARGYVKEANPYEYAKPIVLITFDSRGNAIDPEEVDLKDENEVHLELIL
ncbi:MAG: HD domain-containing phosphohydrolase [bacterium]